MAFIRCSVEPEGRARRGQLWLALAELATAYFVIALALFVNDVPHCWATAATVSLAVIGAATLLDRLEVLSNSTWSIRPEGIDVTLRPTVDPDDDVKQINRR